MNLWMIFASKQNNWLKIDCKKMNLIHLKIPVFAPKSAFKSINLP